MTLTARGSQQQTTCIVLKGTCIGGEGLTLIAGPCAVESRQQILECADMVAQEGVRFLRGGAFKPRTSPYSFQGLEEKGLQYLKEAAERFNLLTVSEVMDGDQISLMLPYVDIFQVGARNMQNFTLLKKLGKIDAPILLKRGMSATYEDLLMSAEYIIAHGNARVILCERGIRTYEHYTRNTLDLAAVPILHALTHLPVIVDPSHGTGLAWVVPPMARAAIAAGADGLMLEVHPDPDHALSDKAQALGPQAFRETMEMVRMLAPFVERKVF